MKHFEKELPESYKETLVVDAKDKKTGLLLNGIGGVVMAVMIGLALWAIGPGNVIGHITISAYLLLVGGMIVYMVLHELTHGAAYKLLTGQKLTFGMTLTVAYCGVPDIYVYRKAALISLLAPFCVFTVVFGAATLAVTDPVYRMVCAVLLAVHWGGCAGDLYDTWLYLTRLTDPRTLMRDTGPKQTFYVPEK